MTGLGQTIVVLRLNNYVILLLLLDMVHWASPNHGKDIRLLYSLPKHLFTVLDCLLEYNALRAIKD